MRGGETGPEQESWFVSYMTATRKLLNTIMSWVCCYDNEDVVHQHTRFV